MSDWANGSKSSSSFQGTTANRVLAALAGYHLKQIHPNQYRCNSPLRPGSDSRGITQPADGKHHLDASFWLQSLSVHLGVQVDRY